MRSLFVRLCKVIGLVALLSLAGFVVVRLIFEGVCWIMGHDMLAAVTGLVASIGFGGWIGIEAYLWIREWRDRRNCKNSAQLDKIEPKFFGRYW